MKKLIILCFVSLMTIAGCSTGKTSYPKSLLQEKAKYQPEEITEILKANGYLEYDEATQYAMLVFEEGKYSITIAEIGGFVKGYIGFDEWTYFVAKDGKLGSMLLHNYDGNACAYSYKDDRYIDAKDPSKKCSEELIADVDAVFTIYNDWLEGMDLNFRDMQRWIVAKHKEKGFK